MIIYISFSLIWDLFTILGKNSQYIIHNQSVQSKKFPLSIPLVNAQFDTQELRKK